MNLKQTTLSLKQFNSLDIHPAAKSAHAQWDDLRLQTSLSNLPSQLQQLLIENTPISAIKEEGEILAFAGFYNLNILDELSVLDGQAFKYQKVIFYPADIDESVLERIAYTEVLRILQFQLNSGNGYASLFHALAGCNFFKALNETKKITQVSFSAMVNITRRILRYQLNEFGKGGKK
ncbi:hypothetical protein RYZ26_06885 [Terasakiella sp. A23]|uniref:hypothetical protein n=1 Tax=Terasakiella sp. FCG-A23 TaxID=3080561 RepID=UPI002955BAFD|nr:hypothetical protein [Terasakiella sp. A23]MDV7339310.1 hypothetical protein [Terasakiella sp. A23]